jgi:hypothetical protein
MKISKELINAICQNRDELGYKYSKESIAAAVDLILTYLFEYKKVTTYEEFRKILANLLLRIRDKHDGWIILNDLIEIENFKDHPLFESFFSNKNNSNEDFLYFVGNSLLVRDPTVYIVKRIYFNDLGEKFER